MFLPLQQELGRALAARSSIGLGTNGVLRSGLMLAGGLVATACLLTLVASPWLVDEALGGDWLLFLALELSLVGFAGTFLARGILSGTGQFGAFGRVVAGEPIARVLIAAGLSLASVKSAAPYGIAIGLAPLVSLAALWLWRRPPHLEPGPPLPVRDLTRPLTYLVASSVLAQAVANAGPLVIAAMAGPGEHAEAGRFLAALTVARVSLFLFQAVQAALLPNLSALVTAGRMTEFKAAIRNLTKGLSVLVVAGGVAAGLMGPWLVGLLFGSGFDIGARTMSMLTVGSMLYVLALALSGAVIALEGHVWNAIVWAVGLAGFAAGVVLSDDLYFRVELGYVIAGSIAAAGQLLVVIFVVRRRSLHTDGALISLNDASIGG